MTAAIADSSLPYQRLKTSRNFCILRSCSHVVRLIDSPPPGGRKPDKSTPLVRPSCLHDAALE